MPLNTLRVLKAHGRVSVPIVQLPAGLHAAPELPGGAVEGGRRTGERLLLPARRSRPRLEGQAARVAGRRPADRLLLPPFELQAEARQVRRPRGPALQARFDLLPRAWAVGSG